MIRKLGFWVLLMAFVGLWAFRDVMFPAEKVIAATAKVVDGDTLIIAGKSWRLYGIDAPEYRQTCKDARGLDWPCGKAARAQLDAYVLSGSIVCEPQAEDAYGRSVARCASATVPDLAEAMSQAGLAISPAGRGRAAYDDAEASARDAKRGIWQGEFDTPAEWRKANPREDKS
jgi:endonuclease YncB( thermonuclease family)